MLTVYAVILCWHSFLVWTMRQVVFIYKCVGQRWKIVAWRINNSERTLHIEINNILLSFFLFCFITYKFTWFIWMDQTASLTRRFYLSWRISVTEQTNKLFSNHYLTQSSQNTPYITLILYTPPLSKQVSVIILFKNNANMSCIAQYSTVSLPYFSVNY